MKLIESARMEGIVDISIKSKESVVNGIKSIPNGGGSAEEDLIDRPDADETTELNDQVWTLTQISLHLIFLSACSKNLPRRAIK